MTLGAGKDKKATKEKGELDKALALAAGLPLPGCVTYAFPRPHLLHL